MFFDFAKSDAAVERGSQFPAIRTIVVIGKKQIGSATLLLQQVCNFLQSYSTDHFSVTRLENLSKNVLWRSHGLTSFCHDSVGYVEIVTLHKVVSDDTHILFQVFADNGIRKPSDFVNGIFCTKSNQLVFLRAYAV